MPKSNTIILTLLYIFFSEHFLRLAFIHSFHPFILYLPYIQNFTLQGAKTRKKLPDVVKAKFFQMTKGLWSKIMEDNNLFKNIVQRNYVHLSYFSVIYSHS